MGRRGVGLSWRSAVPGISENDPNVWSDCHGRSFDIIRRNLDECAGIKARTVAVHPRLGDRFGQLAVTGFVRDRKIRVVFRCDCGSPERVVIWQDVKAWGTKSCHECQRKNHSKFLRKLWGHEDLAERKVVRRLLWVISGIYNRCTNPNDKNWANYGGRGICVAPEWLAGVVRGKKQAGKVFNAFGRRAFLVYLLSLENHSTPGYQLDRIDNDKGYEPGNLRFIDCSGNAKNRRSAGAFEKDRMLLKSLRSIQLWSEEPIHDLILGWSSACT